MADDRALTVAIVAGEESGDLLGADLIRALGRLTGREIRLIGVGGRHLQALGLKSLFDAGDIALMGVSAILRDLPRLLRRIGQTAGAVAAAKPDCLITIDSPDFSLRVARKVRGAEPSIPVVHYVCPSVWAWRPQRAAAMRPYVDRILCVLPFEAGELARLGGPPGSYVGHRLTHHAGVLAAAEAQVAPRDLSAEREKTLLVLPGSRRSEVRKLIGPFGDTVSRLRARGHRLRLLLPTVPHVEELVRSAVSGWEQKPEITVDQEQKWQAFGAADAALVASGTVSLELALCGVPMISCYKLDPLATMIARRALITWSGSLPNLIADQPLVSEHYNDFVAPPLLVREMEALWSKTRLRQWQKEGFAEVARRMATHRPAGELAAAAVMKTMEDNTTGR